MSTWRQFAEQVQRGEGPRDTRDNRDSSSVLAPSVPNVPSVPLDPSRALKRWRAELVQLDPQQPLHSLEPQRWRVLCEDAAWLFHSFGEQAARDCWTTADLFGLCASRPHFGGLVDRLRGSRSLVLTETRACWRSFGVVETFNRSSYPDLRAFWEAQP